MGDSYVTATQPALNSACCYTFGGKPPCLKKKRKRRVPRRHGTAHSLARARTPLFQVTLGQDLLNGTVVLLSIVVVRVSFMGSVVRGNMFPTDVRRTRTELTFMLLPELSRAHLDVVGVLTNPADQLSGCELGLGAQSAHRLGPQYPHWLPEPMRCGLGGDLGSHCRRTGRAKAQAAAGGGQICSTSKGTGGGGVAADHSKGNGQGSGREGAHRSKEAGAEKGPESKKGGGVEGNW